MFVERGAFICTDYFLMTSRRTSFKKHSNVRDHWRISLLASSRPFPLGGQSAEWPHKKPGWRWSFFSTQWSRWCKNTAARTQDLQVKLPCIAKKPGDTDSDVDVIVCYSTLTNVTCRAVAAAHCTLVSSLLHSRAPPHTSPPQVWSSDTDHQLCNPPYSAARLINGLCQRQCQSIGCSFWVCLGVGEELLHSPALCSVTGKVLTLLISFFTALCQNIQLQTLKTSAIARHLQPHTAPLITVDSCTLFFLFFFFSEGGGRDDRLCEW